MRKIVFFILAFISISQSGFAWDTTAAKFYPLKVGNSYTFMRRDYHISCNPSSGSKYKSNTTGERTMTNGKKYFQIGYQSYNDIIISGWKYQRIDSATMNVYGYDTTSQQEYLLDSLLAGQGNNILSSRFKLSGWQASYHTSTTSIFGGTRTQRIFITGASPMIVNYYLVEGIGYAGYGYCVDDGTSSELIGCVINGIVYGDTVTTAVKQISTEVPDKFSLRQNYPNPFNPSTKINYELKSAGFVSLKAFDVMGREISILVNENQSVGSYEVIFDAALLPAGIYYYRIETEEFSEVKKMSLVK